MKIPRLLALLAAALLCAASPYSLPAADVVVDISSFAPRDPNVVVRQIELNVAIKQYEKVLMELHEVRLQRELGPTETGLTDEQQKQWAQRADDKLKYLVTTAADLRERIQSYVAEANREAELVEKTKAGKEAKPKTTPGQPEDEPRG